MPITQTFNGPGVYDWNYRAVGDSILGKTLIIKYKEDEAIKSLAGATVEMNIVRGRKDKIYKTLSTENVGEINIIDAALGIVQIPNINVVDLEEGDYLYNIKVTYSDDLKITFLVGRFPVKHTQGLAEKQLN